MEKKEFERRVLVVERAIDWLNDAAAELEESDNELSKFFEYVVDAFEDGLKKGGEKFVEEFPDNG